MTSKRRIARLNANVLSIGKPSDYSTQILERSALTDRFKSDPQAVLAELNSGLGKPDERDRLFALSELSFEYAEESGNQSYYLAAKFGLGLRAQSSECRCDWELELKVKISGSKLERSIARNNDWAPNLRLTDKGIGND